MNTDRIIIEVEDVLRPSAIQGGKGVTVTNDGKGNVTITAKLPDDGLTPEERYRASTADLDMQDRFVGWATLGDNPIIVK